MKPSPLCSRLYHESGWLGRGVVPSCSRPGGCGCHTEEDLVSCPWREGHKHDPIKPLPTAASICTDAAALVGGDRATTHGDKALNFANTAALWNAIIEAKARQAGWPIMDVLPVLDALDVANMLEAFKIARRYSGSHNPDDYVDGAGYAGCAGEIAASTAHPSREEVPPPFRRQR